MDSRRTRMTYRLIISIAQRVKLGAGHLVTRLARSPKFPVSPSSSPRRRVLPRARSLLGDVRKEKMTETQANK